MWKTLKCLEGKTWKFVFDKHEFVVHVKEVKQARIKDMINPVYIEKPGGGKSAVKMTAVFCEEGNLFFEDGEVVHDLDGVSIDYGTYSARFLRQ